MPAKSQRGIPRPRVTDRDAELREGIIGVLKKLQTQKTLSEIAEMIGTSEKNLSRYLNDKVQPPPVLGGDILFRLCEAGYPVSCRGKVLQCAESGPRGRTKTEQLHFEFVATIDLLLPSRKLVAKVERVKRRREAS